MKRIAIQNDIYIYFTYAAEDRNSHILHNFKNFREELFLSLI